MKRLYAGLAALMLVALAGFPFAQGTGPRVQAQTGATWTAEYYNNAYLSGAPALTRTEQQATFNWGVGSPGPEIGLDNWSARFATDVFFPAGTYRFYILADDGVKLWIDFPPDQRATIDSWNMTQPGVLLSADVTITAGTHHIQVDFREDSGLSYLYVAWDNLADGASEPNFPTPVNLTSPWTAEYYNNAQLFGSPVVIQAEASPAHTWGTAAPVAGLSSDSFSVRWSSYQYLEAGTYTLSVWVDDGARVYVDGRLVLDEFHGATGETYLATFTVGRGQHQFVIEYYDATQDAYFFYGLMQGEGAPPTITGASATVTAYALNVRTAPDTVNGQVITRIRRDETYRIVGRNNTSTWWQLDVSGVYGWVSGRYVTVRNTESVPVTYYENIPTPTATYWWVPTATPYWWVPTPTPYYGSVQCPGFMVSRLLEGGWGQVTPGPPNTLRSQPTLYASALGQIPGNGIFQVIRGPVCADSMAWWLVYYNGLTGWTSEGQGSTYWLQPYYR